MGQGISVQRENVHAAMTFRVSAFNFLADRSVHLQSSSAAAGKRMVVLAQNGIGAHRRMAM
jgi:hypothetical protein